MFHITQLMKVLDPRVEPMPYSPKIVAYTIFTHTCVVMSHRKQPYISINRFIWLCQNRPTYAKTHLQHEKNLCDITTEVQCKCWTHWYTIFFLFFFFEDKVKYLQKVYIFVSWLIFNIVPGKNPVKYHLKKDNSQ